MAGHARSTRGRKETAQRPPERCARCGKRVPDGKGRHVAGAEITCLRCAARPGPQDPPEGQTA